VSEPEAALTRVVDEPKEKPSHTQRQFDRVANKTVIVEDENRALRTTSTNFDLDPEWSEDGEARIRRGEDTTTRPPQPALPRARRIVLTSWAVRQRSRLAVFPVRGAAWALGMAPPLRRQGSHFHAAVTRSRRYYSKAAKHMQNARTKAPRTSL
jgi:hypothetical protein